MRKGYRLGWADSSGRTPPRERPPARRFRRERLALEPHRMRSAAPIGGQVRLCPALGFSGKGDRPCLFVFACAIKFKIKTNHKYVRVLLVLSKTP